MDRRDACPTLTIHRAEEREEVEYLHWQRNGAVRLSVAVRIEVAPVRQRVAVHVDSARRRALHRGRDPVPVVVRVESLGRTVLFVGDMEDKAEHAWLTQLGPDARRRGRGRLEAARACDRVPH